MKEGKEYEKVEEGKGRIEEKKKVKLEEKE